MINCVKSLILKPITMTKIFSFTVFVLLCLSVNSQVVRNVQLVEFRQYFVNVCTEVFRRLQEQHFHTLKLPDFTQEVDTTVLSQPVHGHTVYSNSFLVSIGGVDVLRQQILERWLSPNATTASVSVEGVMRLRNVKMGFDIVAELNGQNKRSTGTMIFPLLHFSYVIRKDLFTDIITVTVATTVQTTPTRITMFPTDNVTDIFTSTYMVTSFNPGVVLWGPEEIQPIAQQVVQEIPFPKICYNCPVSLL